MDIPVWAVKLLKSGDRARIEAAIKEAEASTSGELVPMIVKRSATIGHVPVILFCLFTILFLISGIAEIQAQYFGDSFYLLLIDIAVFTLLANLVSRFDFVCRQLTSDSDIEQQVRARAELEFFEAGLEKTEDSTGILIFLSLMERKVVVLADKNISGQLPKETWQGVVDLLLKGLRNGGPAKGFEDAIALCGRLLIEQYPIKPGDKNELNDHLIIKD
jgi:putative membrane protein